MNIYFILCFVLIGISSVFLFIYSIMDKNKSTIKSLCIVASLFIISFISLGVVGGITLNGKFKADKLYDDYVELLSRINNSDDLTDIEKLQLNMEIDDYNWKLNLNENRLNDFFSTMGNLYEFDYIKIKV